MIIVTSTLVEFLSTNQLVSKMNLNYNDVVAFVPNFFSVFEHPSKHHAIIIHFIMFLYNFILAK